MDDETIRLILDMGQSGQTIEDVKNKLATLQSTTKATADTYDVLSTIINKSVGIVGTYDVVIEKTNVELERERRQVEELKAAQAAYNAQLDAHAAKENAALDAHVRKAIEATQAQKMLSQVLDETATHTTIAAAGVNALTGHGTRGAVGGSGIIGASYAVQDFVSVLSGGGGLGRALGAVSNNVPQLLIGLGAGAGLTGVISLLFTGVAAGIPLIEKWWDSVDSEKAGDAKKKLQEVRAELEKIHAEFKKLAEKPTDYEAMAAEGIKGFLEERGNAEKAKAAVAGAVTNKEAWESVAPDQQKAFREMEAAATATDADIDRQAYEEAAARPANAEAPPWVIREQAKEIAAARREARATAQRKRSEILRGGRAAAAEKIVTGATVAGPAGEGARKRLQQITKGMPGFKELGYYTPEFIKQEEEAFQAQEEAGGVGTEEWAERQRAGVRRSRALQRERDQGDELLRRKKEQLQQEAERKAKQDAAKAEHADEKAIQEQVRLGRQVGKAAAKGPQIGHLDKAQLMPEMTAEMLNNQQMMTANLEGIQAQLQQARRVGDENRRISRQRQQPMANYGW